MKSRLAFNDFQNGAAGNLTRCYVTSYWNAGWVGQEMLSRKKISRPLLLACSYNLGQNKMEQQTPIPAPPPPQNKGLSQKAPFSYP